jgi:hypothetical protein
MLRFCLVMVCAVVAIGACTDVQTPTPLSTATSPPAPSVSPSAAPSPSPSPSAAPSIAPSAPAGTPAIVLLSEEPVVRSSDLDGDHYRVVLAAAYTFYYGVHHAYLVGFGATQGDERVYHALSADGLLWSIDRSDPFETLGLDLSPPGPLPGTVISDGDRGWLMYLWGVPAPAIEGAVLWRATSDSIGGPWIADPEPVLELGAPGSWDDRALGFPAVLATDEGFAMAYSAVGSLHPETRAIGWAETANGTTWERASGEPLIEPGLCGAQSSQYAAAPRVLVRDDGYLMLFDSGRRAFAATSADGETWTCLSEAPLLTEDDIPGSIGIHTFAIADVDGRVSVLIDSLTDTNGVIGSNVWLGELRGL